MRSSASRASLLLGLLLLGPHPAAAETLIAAVSPQRVAITSNFAGTELTVYGSIERDAVTVSRASGYDIVAMLIGPRRTFVTRRKDRVLGLWINRDQRNYQAPSFYAVATTRPLAEIATPETLAARQVGIEGVLPPLPGPGDGEAKEFRDAFLVQGRKAGRYSEYASTVTMLGPHLFSVTLPIPAEVPVGRYDVRVLVFSDGSPVAEQISGVDVEKTGAEAQVADLATHRSTIYGLLAVALALLTGWLGGVLFRRD